MQYKISKGILAFILSILIVLLVSGLFVFWLYSAPFTPKKQQVLNKLPLPIARIGNHIIFSQEVLERQRIVSAFGKKIDLAEALQLIVEDNKKNIVLSKSQADLDSKLEDLLFAQLENQESKSVQEKKNKTGLSEKEYKEKVLSAYRNLYALRLFYNSPAFHKSAYKDAEQIKSSIENNEDIFEVLLKYPQYFKDPKEASLKSDTGYIDKKALLPELQNILTGASRQSVHLVTTTQGIVILKLLGGLPASQTTGEMVSLKIVSFSLKGFEDWLRKNTSIIPVKYYIRY